MTYSPQNVKIEKHELNVECMNQQIRVACSHLTPYDVSLPDMGRVLQILLEYKYYEDNDYL